MRNKASTNPQIDGKPMSFVKLKSQVGLLNLMVYDNRYISKGRVVDSRNVPYQIIDGTIYREKN